MANVIQEQKLVDTNRRTVVKYVASVDTVSANNLLLDVSNLAYSLNANGKIMSSNTHPKSVYRNNIKRIWGQGHFKSKGYVTLLWAGANTDSIISIGDGQFDYNFDAEGLTASIGIKDVANSTGDILYTTAGVAAGDGFTLFVDLKKNGSDYDQGQTADPTAFNPQRIG